MWTNDHIPAPLPTIGNLRLRTSSTSSPGLEGQRGARTVQSAVAQHHAFHPVCAFDSVLDMLDGRERGANGRRRVGVEGVGLALTAPPERAK
jgi:hypothetical protein